MNIQTETINDIPVIDAILRQLDIENQIDNIYPIPKNWQGLSIGKITHIWLIYLLSSCDHRLSYVENWVCDHLGVLSTLVNCEIRREDFCDDKLGLILEYFSDGKKWNDFLSKHTKNVIQVYDLETETFRIDATIGKSFKKITDTGLFQMGNSKHFRADLPQFKMMLATLDPMGLPIASLIVSGEKADDPLYIPVIKQAIEYTKAENKLFVGDSKMSSKANRTFIVSSKNYYLSPLTAVQISKEKLIEYLDNKEKLNQDFQFVFKETEKIAKGFEVIVSMTSEIDGKPLTWEERRLIVRSYQYANSQIKALIKRIEKSTFALKNLNIHKQGKKKYITENELDIVCSDIIKKFKVSDIVQYTIQSQIETISIRAYKNKPARTETKTTFQVQVTINETVLENTKKTLGWRVYATNSPKDKFTLPALVKIYRNEYIVEYCFKNLKDKPLNLLPLYLHLDNRIRGLINVLTLALNGIRVIEYKVHSGLKEQNIKLKGLYAGNPQQKTATPSANLLLKSFENKHCTIITESPVFIEEHKKLTNSEIPKESVETKKLVVDEISKELVEQKNLTINEIPKESVETKKLVVDEVLKKSDDKKYILQKAVPKVFITPLTFLQTMILNLLGVSSTVYSDLEKNFISPYTILENRKLYDTHRKKSSLNIKPKYQGQFKYFDSG